MTLENYKNLSEELKLDFFGHILRPCVLNKIVPLLIKSPPPTKNVEAFRDAIALDPEAGAEFITIILLIFLCGHPGMRNVAFNETEELLRAIEEKEKEEKNNEKI